MKVENNSLWVFFFFRSTINSPCSSLNGTDSFWEFDCFFFFFLTNSTLQVCSCFIPVPTRAPLVVEVVRDHGLKTLWRCSDYPKRSSHDMSTLTLTLRWKQKFFRFLSGKQTNGERRDCICDWVYESCTGEICLIKHTAQKKKKSEIFIKTVKGSEAQMNIFSETYLQYIYKEKKTHTHMKNICTFTHLAAVAHVHELVIRAHPPLDMQSTVVIRECRGRYPQVRVWFVLSLTCCWQWTTFIFIYKKVRPGTEPWGTPQVMSGKEADKMLSVKEKIRWAT